MKNTNSLSKTYARRSIERRRYSVKDKDPDGFLFWGMFAMCVTGWFIVFCLLGG